jgi:hypothetical protein
MVMSLRSKWAAGKAVRAGPAFRGRIPHQFTLVAIRVDCGGRQTGAGRNRSGDRRTAAGPFSNATLRAAASWLFFRPPAAGLDPDDPDMGASLAR